MANNGQSWEDIRSYLTQIEADPNVNTSDAAHQAFSMVEEKVENFYSSATSILNKVVEFIYSFEKTIVQFNENELDRRKKILTQELDYASLVINNSMKTITSGFTKTANQLAHENTRMMQQNVIENVKTQNAIRVANLSAQIENKKAVKEMTGLFLDTATGIVDFAATYGANAAGEAITSAVAIFDDKKSAMLTGEIAGFTLGNISGMPKTAVNVFATAMKEQMGLEIAQNELQLHQMEAANNLMESVMQKAQEVLEPWQQLVQQTEETWMKVDTASRKLAVTMGYYGNQGASYTTHIMSMGEHMATVFGKEITDLVEAQKQYADASERNVMLGLSGQEAIAGTERLFGISQGEVAQLYGGMNVFNTSIESAGGMMEGMYHTITKMGLSASKFSKDLVNNLQLAQKYNFRGGVENMMKLTQWANQTRFNLQSATSFSDKLTSANLSDALETSAKLQVLGGSAAIYSDPLGMLYDAGADVGDMAHRMANMFNDLSGTFNKTTGETEFSWYENYMIKQRAAALGMDDKDVKNMIRQNNKQGIINRELRGYGLDDETKTAIGNRATYNQKAGRWEVKSLTGDTFDMKTLAEHPELLKNVLPEDNEEAMLQIAQRSLSYEEQQLNYTKAIAAKLGVEKEDVIKEALSTRLNDTKAFYNENWGDIGQTFNTVEDYITKMSNAQLQQSSQVFGAEGRELINNITQGFLNSVQSVLNDTNFKNAMREFAKGSDALRKWAEGQVGVDKNAQDVMKAVFDLSLEAAEGTVETGKKTAMTIKDVVRNIGNFFSGKNENGETTGIPEVFSTVKNSVNDADAKLGEISDKMDRIIPLKGGTVEPKESKKPTTTEAKDAIMIDQKSNNLIQPSPNDQFLFAQTGGPIDVLFKGIFGEIQSIGSYIKTNGGTRGGNSNLNIQLSGEIKLNENGKSYNLLDDLKTRDIFAAQIASTLQEKMSSAIANSANTSDFNWGRV